MLILSLLILNAAAKPVSIAAPGLTTVGLTDAQVDVYVDYFTQQLTLQGGVTVITRSEVAAQLGLERQRQLLGCSDGSTSCVAELAGALGTDAILTGSIAKAEAGFVANLKVVATSGSKVFGVYSDRVANESALYDFLKASARDLAAKLGGAQAAPVAATGPRSVAWVPAVVGAALLVGAGVLYGLALDDAAKLRAGNDAIMNSTLFAQGGRTKETMAWVLGGVGLAAGVTALVLWLLPSAPATPARVALVPTTNGLALTGWLP